MEPILLFSSFIFGAIVGSFLNVVILRLPQENSSIVFPASHCPSCKTDLRWFENIPIFSYLFLRGKCSHCKVKISPQYPVVEALMATLSCAIFFKYGVSIAAGGYFIFCAALLAIIWIDIHHQIIPNVISLPGIVLGFLFSFINPFVSWQSSLIGLIAGYGILFIIAEAYYFLRKHEGMGGGDMKLLAMIGAFLGWQSLLFVIFFSSLIGSIAGILAMPSQKKGGATRIAFGPFLSLAALFFLFFSQQIFYYYGLYNDGKLFSP